jgi:hypothetical protein
MFRQIYPQAKQQDVTSSKDVSRRKRHEHETSLHQIRDRNIASLPRRYAMGSRQTPRCLYRKTQFTRAAEEKRLILPSLPKVPSLASLNYQWRLFHARIRAGESDYGSTATSL